MEKEINPQYEAYLGLKDIVFDQDSMQSELKSLVKYSIDNGKDHRNKEIKFLDTFFSDNLLPKTLYYLFNKVKGSDFRKKKYYYWIHFQV